MNTRPNTDEYAEFYAGYVGLVTETDAIATLHSQIDELRQAIGSLSDERGSYRYADGKWSIKELVGHIIDAERVFAYRILRFARADETPLPGFDQDPYIDHNNAPSRAFADLVEEFDLVRRSNIKMIENLNETDLLRRGTASENPITVRALITIMIGHARHHLNILNERYLVE